MTAKEFLKNKLEKLSKTIPGIKIRFESQLNPECVTINVVEIMPLNIYEENNKYVKAEYQIELDFLKRFPEQEILFISEGSKEKIINPEFEIESKK